MSYPFNAVISDLDGTLLNAEHRIGQFTIDTLNKLAQKGIDIYFATGRNYPDVKHIIRKIEVKQAMLVTSNGARVNDLAGNVLASYYLDEAIAFDIMQTAFDDKKVCLNSYQGDEWFVNKDITQLKAFHQDSGFSYQVVDFALHHGRQTEKLFFISREAEALQEIEKTIQAKYGNAVYLTYSTAQCLEVMHPQVSKANALKYLMAKQPYGLEHCIAFGDGMNDVEMLKSAGKGCLMENADPRLKAQLPDFEVIGANKDEAVAYYLAKLFQL